MNASKLTNLKEPNTNPFTSVTKLSKIVALVLFILLPFVGFYLGIVYQKIRTVRCDDLQIPMKSTSNENPAESVSTMITEEVIPNTEDGIEINTESTPTTYNPNTGWKIYENNEKNFKFEYPADYYITQEGYWGDKDSPDTDFYLDLSKYKPDEVPPIEFAGVRIIVSKFSGDLYEEAQERVKGFREYDPEKPPQIEKAVVGGVQAYRFFGNYIFSNKGLLYSINNGIDEVLFTKILSTFKFIK